MSSDESPAVVELPDDAIEAALHELLMVAEWPGPFAPQPVAEQIVTKVYPLIAARVRAEALADVAENSGGEAIEDLRNRVACWMPAYGVNGRELVDDLIKAVRAEAATEYLAEQRYRIGVGAQIEAEKRAAEAERDEYHRNWQEAEKRTAKAVAEAVAGERRRSAPAESAAEQLLRDIFMDPGPVATPPKAGHGQYAPPCVCAASYIVSPNCPVHAASPVATPTEPAHMHNWDGPCSACPSVTPTDADGGAALIAAERKRQIDVEGWTAEHDDQHGPAVLLDASLCYQAGELNPDPREYRNGYGRAAPLWPWNTSWWKPKDRLRNLVRAGALAQAAAEVAGRRVAAIAAEIDGLQAASPVPAEQPAAADQAMAARAEQALAQRVLDAHDDELGTRHGVAYRAMVADHWRLIKTFEPHRTGARAAFDRRAGEEAAGAELLGHRLTVGEAAEQPEER